MAELYIDGAWADPVGGGHREIRCPADGTLVATVSEATGADTEAAILAARRALSHDDAAKKWVDANEKVCQPWLKS